jgi:hypothetical protein
LKKLSSVPWSILLALGLAGQAFAQGYIGAFESCAPAIGDLACAGAI